LAQDLLMLVLIEMVSRQIRGCN